MPGNIAWTTIDGGDLLDARDEGRISDLVPFNAGIYLWRRKLVAPNSCKASGQAFCSWIVGLTQQASARMGRRSLSHCVWADGMQVGGGGLTDDKEETLKSIATNSKLRRIVISYVESLSEFCPPIYIGEANDLSERVKDHIRGDTALLPYVEGLLHLQIQDLQFQYFVTNKNPDVSVEAKAIQELLEIIAQRVLAPFATDAQVKEAHNARTKSGTNRSKDS